MELNDMKRILIIDDEKEIRSLLRKQLEKVGYMVEEASDGRHGIRQYSENPSDLVITDIIMPEVEGIETIREIRKKDPNAKIIAMSGGGRNNAQGYLKISKQMGALHTFEKPFHMAELLETVKTIIG